MPNQSLHEDFGEKIGGAKKDLWRVRGLYIDDLDDMNEREADKYVKKDNVWKKPNYQAMLDDGVPLGVVYFTLSKRRATLYPRRRDISAFMIANKRAINSGSILQPSDSFKR